MHLEPSRGRARPPRERLMSSTSIAAAAINGRRYAASHPIQSPSCKRFYNCRSPLKHKEAKVSPGRRPEVVQQRLKNGAATKICCWRLGLQPPASTVIKKHQHHQFLSLKLLLLFVVEISIIGVPRGLHGQLVAPLNVATNFRGMFSSGPLLPPPPPPPQMQPVFVPGSGPLLRQADRVDEVVLPYDSYGRPTTTANGSSLISPTTGGGASNIIDHKRFVESVSSRCFASTVLEDPDSVEPNFVIIKPSIGETRVNATASGRAILAAGFEPRKRTIIFVHGFTQSYPSTDWLRAVRALYERNQWIERENLIIMDWGRASSGSYSQVAAKVSGMGSFLANFLMKLVGELGADRASIHLVGHSLGAHLVGFAGKRMRPRLGRITALDPAGPCFGKLFSNSPQDRLAPDDAFQVDVYHYDDDFLGLPAPLGQVDVYVNGGSSQPGCTDNYNAMFQAALTLAFRRNRVLSESHTRSTEVPSCQLAATGCQQVAYECRDYAAFLAGECGQCDDDNQQCHLMSFHFQYNPTELDASTVTALRATHPSRRMYVSTGGNAQYFCIEHYQLVVKFEPHPEMAQLAKRNKWRLLVELLSEQNERLNVTMTNQMAPNIFSYLLLQERRPTRFVSALLQVRQYDNSLVNLREGYQNGGEQAQYSHLRSPFKVSSLEVRFMSSIKPQVRQALSSHLCPSEMVQLAPLAQSNSIADSSGADDWLAFDQCNGP